MNWKTFTIATVLKNSSVSFWETITTENVKALTRQWVCAFESEKQAELDNLKKAVLYLDYTASLEARICFVVHATNMATSNDTLSDIGAGSIEHMLGFDGYEAFQRIKTLCTSNPKLLIALTAVWQHKMNDELWDEVQNQQKTADRFLEQYGRMTQAENEKRVVTSTELKRAFDKLAEKAEK